MTIESKFSCVIRLKIQPCSGQTVSIAFQDPSVFGTVWPEAVDALSRGGSTRCPGPKAVVASQSAPLQGGAACRRTLNTRRLSRSHRTTRTETPRRLVSSPGAIQRQLRFRQSGQRRRFPTPPSKGICQPAARRRRGTGSGRSWTKTRATPRLFRRKRSGEGRRAASPPYRTAATAGERARPSRLPD